MEKKSLKHKSANKQKEMDIFVIYGY